MESSSLAVASRLNASYATATRYGWTTGAMPGIIHEHYIASGAFGQVHQVHSRGTVTKLDAR